MPKSLATEAPQSNAPVQPPSFSDYANQYTTKVLGNGINWDGVDEHFNQLPPDPQTGKKPNAADFKKEVASSYEKDVLPQYYPPDQLPQAQAYARAELAPIVDKFVAQAPVQDKGDAKIRSLVELQENTKDKVTKSAIDLDIFKAQKTSGEKLIADKGLRDMDLTTANAWLDEEIKKRQAAAQAMYKMYSDGEANPDEVNKHLDTLSMEVHHLQGARNVLNDSNDLATAAVYAGGGVIKLLSTIGEVAVRGINGTSSMLSPPDKMTLGTAFKEGYGADSSVTKFFSGITDAVDNYEENFDSGDNSKAALDVVAKGFDASVADGLRAVWGHPSSALRVLTTAVPESLSQMAVGGGIGNLGGKLAAKAIGKLATTTAEGAAATAQAGKYAGVVTLPSIAGGTQDAAQVKAYLREQFSSIDDDKFLGLPDVQAESDVWRNLSGDKLKAYIDAKKESMVRQAYSTVAGTATSVLTLSSMLGARYGAEAWILGNAKSIAGKTALRATTITGTVGGIHEAAEGVTEQAIQHFVATDTLGSDMDRKTPFSNYGNAAFQGFVAGVATDSYGGYAGYKHNKASEAAAAKNTTTTPPESTPPQSPQEYLKEIERGIYTNGKAKLYSDAELKDPKTVDAINKAYTTFSGKDVPYSYDHIAANPEIRQTISNKLWSMMEVLKNTAGDPTADKTGKDKNGKDIEPDLLALRARQQLLTIQALIKADNARKDSAAMAEKVLGGTKQPRAPLALPFNVETTDPREALTKAKSVLSTAEVTTDSNELAKHLQTLDGLMAVVNTAPELQASAANNRVSFAPTQPSKHGLTIAPPINAIANDISGKLATNIFANDHNEVKARLEALKQNAPSPIGAESKTAIAEAAGLPTSNTFTSMAAIGNKERTLGIDVGYDDKGDINIALSSVNPELTQYNVVTHPIEHIVSGVTSSAPNASLIEQYNAALNHVNNFMAGTITAGGMEADMHQLNAATQYAVARELLSKLRPDYVQKLKGGKPRSASAMEKAGIAVNTLYRTMIENSARTIDGGVDGDAYDYIVGNTLVVPERTSAPMSLLNRLRNEWFTADSFLRDRGADRVADLFSDLKHGYNKGAVVTRQDSVYAQSRQVSAAVKSHVDSLSEGTDHKHVTEPEMLAIQRIAESLNPLLHSLNNALDDKSRANPSVTTNDKVLSAMEAQARARAAIRSLLVDKLETYQVHPAAAYDDIIAALEADDAATTPTEYQDILNSLDSSSESQVDTSKTLPAIDGADSPTTTDVRLARVIDELGLGSEPELLEAIHREYEKHKADPNQFTLGKRRKKTASQELHSLLGSLRNSKVPPQSAPPQSAPPQSAPPQSAPQATATPIADVVDQAKRIHDEYLAGAPSGFDAGTLSRNMRRLAEILVPTDVTKPSQLQGVIPTLSGKRTDELSTADIARAAAAVISGKVNPQNAVDSIEDTPATEAVKSAARPKTKEAPAKPKGTRKLKQKVNALDNAAQGRTVVEVPSEPKPVAEQNPIVAAAVDMLNNKQPAEIPSEAKAILEAPLETLSSSLAPKAKKKPKQLVKGSTRRKAIDDTDSDIFRADDSSNFTRVGKSLEPKKAIVAVYNKVHGTMHGVGYGDALVEAFNNAFVSVKNNSDNMVSDTSPEVESIRKETDALFDKFETDGVYATLLASPYISPSAKSALAISAKIGELLLGSKKFKGEAVGFKGSEPKVHRIIIDENGYGEGMVRSKHTYISASAKMKPKTKVGKVAKEAIAKNKAYRGFYDHEAHAVAVYTESSLLKSVYTVDSIAKALAHELIHASTARALLAGKRLYLGHSKQLTDGKQYVYKNDYELFNFDTSMRGNIVTGERPTIYGAAKDTQVVFKKLIDATLTPVEQALVDYYLITETALAAIGSTGDKLFGDLTTVRGAAQKSFSYYGTYNAMELHAEAESETQQAFADLVKTVQVDLSDVGTKLGINDLGLETIESLKLKGLNNIAEIALPTVAQVIRKSNAALLSSMQANSLLLDSVAANKILAAKKTKGIAGYISAITKGIGSFAFGMFLDNNMAAPSNIDYTKLDQFNENC